MKPNLIIIALLAGNLSAAEPTITTRYVAIDNVCAWPNLATLRDGTIVATIFSKPSHGRAEGDAECWVTSDGLFWSKRGTAAPHEDSANRMNLAAGVANNGDLLVLSSGWTLKKDDKGKVLSLVDILAPWVCRSSDGGATWTVDKKSFPRAAEGRTEFIPFGDVLPGGDGALRVACYARDNKTRQDGVWFFHSADDGKTWRVQSQISDANNETAIFHLGSGKWLAAARSLGKTKQRLDLFRSDDDGKTWTFAEPVSGASQHPGHLMRLKDGRLLVTYGNRIKGQQGVLVRLSADDGKTWGEPLTLVNDLVSGDCGYPASAQMRDGKVLSAYYSNGTPAHRRYHMGVVVWEPPALDRSRVNP
jgi:Neuraminidase (sialidase)